MKRHSKALVIDDDDDDNSDYYDEEEDDDDENYDEKNNGEEEEEEEDGEVEERSISPKIKHESYDEIEEEEEGVDNEDDDDDDNRDYDEDEDPSIWEDANLELKPNHESLPLYVTSKRIVYLETFSPMYKEATAFLIAIAVPLSRLRCIHEYLIDNHTLFSAMSVGKTAAQIIGRLRYYAKTTTLPQAVEAFIAERSNYGTLRGCLEGARYTARSQDKNIMDTLSRDAQILSFCRQQPQGVYKAAQDENSLWKYYDVYDEDDDDDDYSWKIDTENEESADENEDESGRPKIPDVYCLDFLPKYMTSVKERLYNLKYPVIEEYFFTDDIDTSSTQPLPIGLNSGVVIRPYQKDALMKMFRNGRAHSGIIVLPCGAGKTLTAIAACCTIKKSCLVLCDKK